jgi:outer membrane scaffolding protein for murein synthesis (MipA/OmpV family)
MRFLLSIMLVLLAPVSAEAGKWLDYLRKYDLNDYAVGLAATATQNPYVGADNGSYAYPYLTSFEHPTLNDSWLVIRDGELGLRRITSNGWELGLAGRVRTLGFGNHDSDQLRGVAEPKWSLELGPVIGLRRWPLQAHLATFFEPTGRHDGVTSRLSLSYPLQYARIYVVPEVSATYQSGDYADYYYAVSAEEATATRPEYAPGATLNSEIKLSFGFELNERWLLTGKVGVEYLADEIRNSPIVGRDKIWSASLGFAYDADVFRSGGRDNTAPGAQRFDVRFGVFQTSADTKIGRETSDGIPGDEIDLEDVLGESDKENVMQVDAIWRIGRYHRIEAGFFELARSSSATITEDLAYGQTVFESGTDVESRSRFKSLRFGYAYSLIRDTQKELGVMAGVHFSSFESIITSSVPADREESRLEAPLPVVGLHALVNVGEKTTVAAKLQFFRTDFDDYEGSLNYFTVDAQRQIGESLKLGIGYNYYYMRLRSSDRSLNGFVEIQHRGPLLFLSYNF